MSAHTDRQTYVHTDRQIDRYTCIIRIERVLLVCYYECVTSMVWY